MDDFAVSSTTEELRATSDPWPPPARSNASRTAGCWATSAPLSMASENTVVSTTPGRVARPAAAPRASAAALPPVRAGSSAASSPNSTMKGRSASMVRGAVPTCASVIPRNSYTGSRMVRHSVRVEPRGNGPRGSTWRSACPRVSLTDGKDDLEPSIARSRLQADLTAVASDDDPPRDVEAEAGALPDLLGGEERLE